MPVNTDNIDAQRRKEIRAQGRARQARLAARKRAEKALLLAPTPSDIDAEIFRSLLATEQPAIIAEVIRGAFHTLKSAGFQGVKPALMTRTSDLRPSPAPSAATFSASQKFTPGDTPVTPTDANPYTPDRIADPTGR